PYVLVDAFTSEPFAGNPAAVCLLTDPLPRETLQAIASEFNLSETAFVRAIDDGFELRWFTPKDEVALCGHATLATAYALQRTFGAALPNYRFQTLSGELTCAPEGELLELNFPATPPIEAPVDPALIEGLGIKDYSHYARSIFDVMVVLPREEDVITLAPDYTALAAVDTRGIIVTAAASEPGIDFVSRFFAPAHGINGTARTPEPSTVMGYAPFHSAVRLSIPCFESLSRDYPLRTALWRASRLPTGLTLLCFYALLN
ncbi:MAG: PhzF family phenazine biosynthesis protein, partial [Gammaproteobacteria bacterium]|nr:PhzF family phenazine biosynthesis protein [Gammaproteobacteria bacterium]